MLFGRCHQADDLTALRKLDYGFQENFRFGWPRLPGDQVTARQPSLNWSERLPLQKPADG